MYIGLGREFWINYSWPGFLAVVWLASSPTPIFPLYRQKARCDTQEDCERDTTYWRERGKEVGEEPTKKPGFLWIIHYYLGIANTVIVNAILGWEEMSLKTIVWYRSLEWENSTAEVSFPKTNGNRRCFWCRPSLHIPSKGCYTMFSCLLCVICHGCQREHLATVLGWSLP